MLIEKMIKENEELNQSYQNRKRLVLVGSPNVGKSSLFNCLTGMHQHTGNWPGKTVEVASGSYVYHKQEYEVIDLPGIYSLCTHSAEEEVARDYICFEPYDLCVIVCDATLLERNLMLVLQVLECTGNVLLVLNMMDEVKQKKIRIDFDGLQSALGIRVVGVSAHQKDGIDSLKQAIQEESISIHQPYCIPYDSTIEDAIKVLSNGMEEPCLNKRYLSLKLLDPQESMDTYISCVKNKEQIRLEAKRQQASLQETIGDRFADDMMKARVQVIQNLQSYIHKEEIKNKKRFSLDDILTHKVYGIIVMFLLLALIFWITISFANVPSAWLSMRFEEITTWLHQYFQLYDVHPVLEGIVVDGMVKTVGWVVSVMLPPMAIFFPMFTALEDFGYLPRVAFNMDGFLQRANTCGKQALTMAMGFGCNAVGVSGARIIDSPRERLIAILTNALIPCNGRFPTLLAIITMFFAGYFVAPWNHVVSAILLTLIIALAVFISCVLSKVLSQTILKGIPSSFTLELPPYRKPQLKQVLVRSLFDRTLHVLARAIKVSIPAGVIIWLLANVTLHDQTLLSIIATTLDPFAYLMGLDGIILLAFILGFPANEIVVPIMIMAYVSSGSMLEIEDLSVLKTLFVDHGWTWVTAVCTILFCIAHFPCATTLLTIKKETQSRLWTTVAFLLPTITGIVLCIGFHMFVDLFILLLHL